MIQYKNSGFQEPMKYQSKFPNAMPARAAEIKALRKEGMTQKQIAEELGLTRVNVNNYMRRYNIK